MANAITINTEAPKAPKDKTIKDAVTVDPKDPAFIPEVIREQGGYRVNPTLEIFRIDN